MMNNCLCMPYSHRITALSLEPADAATSVIMTATNSTNVAAYNPFNFVLTGNPNNVVTGDPLPYQININGANVAVLDVLGNPINSNRIIPRFPYLGIYVVPETGEPHLTVLNVPYQIRGRV